ncbi:hypothetical protein [Croceicoccus bisphenolivorans]|uniref:hypothetical protein n=1 Tax=Croceicoccus bisphenolivorans TaxID=1783232 RepID=UPI00082BF8BC|nr:hypothetical protein [Croceicoccus bisphenolivorans]
MTIQKMLLRTAALVLAPLATGACATYPSDAPIVAEPVGSFVAIDQPVLVNEDFVLTAKAVYEDSRCPTGVQCVWGGRVVVTTQIDAPSWRETVNLVSGERQTVRGHDFLLIEVLPARRPQDGIPMQDYRFRYTMDYHL